MYDGGGLVQYTTKQFSTRFCGDVGSTFYANEYLFVRSLQFVSQNMNRSVLLRTWAVRH